MAKEYDPKEIEPKWQKEWEKNHQGVAKDKGEKYYSLIEFPYPSGDGLHVGHVRSYTALDVVSRKRRMQGYDVLYPIGWDAFGLPTENYAIKTGRQPAEITKENTDNFRRQMKALGLSFDWSREINTTDPKYYKWTQWIFLQFLKHGLAYKAKTKVNWCPKDKIVLANEEVVDGRCERCGTEVEEREREQWLLKITDYAEKLLEGLKDVDYPERVKAQQRNWIGKSEGAELEFEVKGESRKLKVFTTRPDTIFGATFLVVSGKADKFTGKYAINPATKEEIPIWEAEYVLSDYGTGAIMAVPAHDERDFEFAKKHNLQIRQVVEPTYYQTTEPGKIKDGEPFDHREAIIAIVKHWSEEKYIALKWKEVAWGTFITGGIEKGQTPEEAARMELREEVGYLNAKFIKDFGVVHGKFYHVPKKTNRNAHAHVIYLELLNGNKEETSSEEKSKHEVLWLSKEELKKFLTPDTHQHALRWLKGDESPYTGEGTLSNSGQFNRLESPEAKKEIVQSLGGKWVTKYKLRDWIFSRQRYWGEPIPVIHCEECGIVPVPERDLPVELPKVEKYQPTESGDSPLANISEWVNVQCPKCDGPAKRETDVMPNWAGSSWYFLRYTDPRNDQEFASAKALEHWMPVDWYNGGMEHTTLHLLYSRFWHKFLFDIGLIPKKIGDEPYKKRTSHGIILAEGGEKMSKSKGNVVNPDHVIERFGADTLRVYEMFMGPFEQAIAWNESALVGPRRFLERVYKMKEKIGEGKVENEYLLHSTIKKVSEDIEKLGFNTAVSTLMIFTNELENQNKITLEEYETLLKLLSPFAPHITAEIWQELGHDQSIQEENWPKYDEGKLVRTEVTYAVQVNGKVRATLSLSTEVSQAELEKRAQLLPEVTKWIGEKEVKKVIVIPNKVINIVI